MTRDEFLATQSTLACQSCGTVGELKLEENPNNGGVRPVCPSCGSKTPIPGAQWLAQRVLRTPRRVRAELEAVWSECGDHCAFCGLSKAYLEANHIGRTIQHIVPFWKGGDAYPVIPFCARCQQMSTAEQERVRRLESQYTELQLHAAQLRETIARLEKQFPELNQG
jgi:hypothetical protein